MNSYKNSEFSILIVLHVFNEEKTIHRAIKSLQVQDTLFRCLISDNCSTDSTKKIIIDLIHQDERFELVGPTKHLSQIRHWEYAVDYALVKYGNAPFCMIFGGDDELIEKNYLATLSSGLNNNLSADIACPKIQLYNYTRNESRDVLIEVNNCLKAIRFMRHSIKSSQSGHFNFNIGLMRMETFRNWYFTYIKFANIEKPKDDTTSRPILAEFIALIDLMYLRKIYGFHNVCFRKEIQNRDGLVARKKNINGPNLQLTKRKLFVHQIQSFLTPLKSLNFFWVILSPRQRSLCMYFGINYFLSNFSSLVFSSLISRYRNQDNNFECQKR